MFLFVFYSWTSLFFLEMGLLDRFANKHDTDYYSFHSCWFTEQPSWVLRSGLVRFYWLSESGLWHQWVLWSIFLTVDSEIPTSQDKRNALLESTLFVLPTLPVRGLFINISESNSRRLAVSSVSFVFEVLNSIPDEAWDEKNELIKNCFAHYLHLTNFQPSAFIEICRTFY